jgi:hypothetical protein
MAARKKVTTNRTTKKGTRTSAAPKRAPAKTTKVKAKAKPKTAVKAAKPSARSAKPSAKRKPEASSRKATAKRQATAKRKATASSRKAKAKTSTKANVRSKAAAITRRDATGHLDPKYAADLRARSHASAEDLGNDNAFLRRSRAHDPLTEELGEEAVSTMTSGEDQSARMQDLEVEEESGGPFVTTSGREEYALGTDQSNPGDATREPFPTT